MAAKTWTVATSGVWGVAGNWTPSGVPTAADDATITGASGSSYASVTGSGASNSLTLLGNVSLAGAFTTGAFSVGNTAALGAAILSGGAVLGASSATLLAGPLQVSGAGTKLGVGGLLTLGGPRAGSYLYAQDALTVAAGALVQVGGLTLAAGLGADSVSIDAASALEVGTVGGAGAGTLTVDARQMVSGAGSLTAANGFVNAGTIAAAGGLLTLNGAVNGGGSLVIGAGATLLINSAAAPVSEGISFAGTGGTLDLTSYSGIVNGSFSTGLVEQGVIANFAVGDTLLFSGSFGSVSLGSSGALMLISDGATTGSVKLLGDYTNYTFVAAPSGSGGMAVTLVPTLVRAAQASAGTAAADAYSWSSSSSGGWYQAGNWTDTTLMQVAGVAPGGNDAVTINGGLGTQFIEIAGPGNSASLSLLGNTYLNGAFGTGALAVGSGTVGGTLVLGAGTSLTASAAAVANGVLEVVGAAAKLTVSGTVTVGGVLTGANALRDALLVSSGAVVQAGGLVLAAASAADEIQVDSTASLELGTVGQAAAGTITVDAGQSIAGSGGISASVGIVDQGVILAQGGTLSLYANVSGAGQLQIGAGATLLLGSEDRASSTAIAFTGAGGTLALQSFYGTTLHTGQFTTIGTISGFVLGDMLTYGGAVTSAVYTAGSGGLGTLTLSGSSGIIGSLTLAGTYSGYTFQVTPTTSGSTITLAARTIAAGTASPGTPTPDAYVWIGAGSSLWNTAGNWKDVSTGAAPAGIAPGSNDSVSIAGGGTQYVTVTGPGNSASLALTAEVALSGSFNTGALTVGTGAASGSLSFVAGTTMGAASLTVVNGTVQVAGAATRLAISGALTLGGAAAGPSSLVQAFSVSAGAAVQAGSLVLAPPNSSTDSVTVDGTSSLELGSAGTVAAGVFQVDAGSSLSGGGLISAASIVNQGSITALGSLALDGSVSGSGALQIGAGSTLALNGTTNTGAVTFAGSGGVLQFGSATVYDKSGLPTTRLSEQGVINGFVPGDSLVYSGTVTSAVYKVGSGGLGTLTLLNGSTSVGAVTLAGGYADATFQVVAGASSSTITMAWSSPDPLFDVAYYLAQNPDVAAAGVDPYQHYMTVGWKEGRNPSALFNTTYYENQNPDVKAAGVNPLSHFETMGWREGRDPSIGFSDSRYLAANPDVRAAGIDPLLHYVVSGQFEGRAAYAATPHTTGPQDPLVDAAYVYAHNPGVAAAGLDAGAWYHSVGWTQGADPNAYFSTTYYENQNLDVKAAGVDPLAHFETTGWREGRDPSIAFSDSRYLAANPDVRAAGIDPLLHYLANGQYEGRAAYAASPHATGPQDPLVDAAYVYAHNPAVAAAGLDASGWYNSVGWKAGANPDAFFDTNYYLAQNPDVRAAGIDPLAHFEANGWREGRDPSLLFSDGKYLAVYGDVRAAGIDPLVHYMSNGQYEGRSAFLAGAVGTADSLVNTAYYDAQLGATLIPGGLAGAQQAEASYDGSGWQKGLNPDAYFNTSYYLSHNPDVAAAHIDPLLHYENFGWKEGRDPSALFSTSKYLAAYADVKAAGVDPLLHYVVNGQAEGRVAFAV